MNIIEEIDKIYKKNNNICLFLDMDGTIVEFLINSEESFMQKGGYVKKAPIKPIINKIEEIKIKFPLIKIKILSCSKTNEMKKEKNIWLDKYLPYINKENRIILSEENGDYNQETINMVKANYIKNNLKEDNMAILIDDDIRILLESKKILKEKILPIHVTSLLI
jgi:hypothetical protein